MNKVSQLLEKLHSLAIDAQFVKEYVPAFHGTVHSHLLRMYPSIAEVQQKPDSKLISDLMQEGYTSIAVAKMYMQQSLALTADFDPENQLSLKKGELEATQDFRDIAFRALLTKEYNAMAGEEISQVAQAYIYSLSREVDEPLGKYYKPFMQEFYPQILNPN